jgi:hypothetical protein
MRGLYESRLEASAAADMNLHVFINKTPFMRGLVPESRLELPSAAADMNLLLIL